MEPLYYDVNFVNSKNFKQKNIISLIKFLLYFKVNIDIEIIESLNFDNFNFDVYNNFYYWNSNWIEYHSKKVILTPHNYEKVLSENTIFTLSLKFSNNFSLKMQFCFEKDWLENIFNCINIIYTINYNIDNIDDILFIYIWESFYKFIEILDPEIISMWEATLPITKIDIKSWNIWWNFLYINKNLINEKKLSIYNNIIYNNLSNWYLFYYLYDYNKIFSNILK